MAWLWAGEVAVVSVGEGRDIAKDRWSPPCATLESCNHFPSSPAIGRGGIFGYSKAV